MSSGAPAISDALALGFDVGGQSVKAVAVDHEGRVLQAATAPTGIATDGNKAWVLAANRFRVTEVSLAPLHERQAGQAVTEIDLRADTPSVGRHSAAYAADPLPAAAREGRAIFFNAHNNALSADHAFACATCHLNGAEDQQTWFVAGGPRQTPVLAGRLAGTFPYNWKGSEQLLQDNMKDTVHRMGGKGLAPASLASLASNTVLNTLYLQNGLLAGGLPSLTSLTPVLTSLSRSRRIRGRLARRCLSPLLQQVSH